MSKKEPKFYTVGGYVRDKLLGVPSKDIDYAVEADSYNDMRDAILSRGGNIFLEQEKYLTIRAKVPKLGAADFVLCRKDGTYTTDGRRPDFVEIGTLYDDLARRDLTINAMALDEEGNLIDFFNGKEHLDNRLLHCVGDTETRMREDSLRMLRVIRFAITKNFRIDYELDAFLRHPANAELLDNISVERIREELVRCFKTDSFKTMNLLTNPYFYLGRKIFSKNLHLVPTIHELQK